VLEVLLSLQDYYKLNRIMPRKILKILLMTAMVLTVSCAATLPEDIPPDIKWPMPPERTRVQFVDYIIGSRDVLTVKDSKTKALILGDAPETKLLKPTFPYYKNGVLYVSDIESVKAFDFKNKRFWTISSSQHLNTSGLAVLSDGTVYIGDSVRKCIFRSKPGRSVSEKITKPRMFGSVGGMDVNEEKGLIYVVDPKKHDIKVLDLEGNLQFIIGHRGKGKAEFNYPYDVKVGPGGRIYISDAGNFRVQILDGEGVFLGMFGGIGTQMGSFARPKGLALDKDGNIYIIDSVFGNFQIFNQRGQLMLVVGSVGKDPGMHLLPVGIFINKENRIFVTEHGNKRIQIYKYFSYDDEEITPPVPLRPKDRIEHPPS
jgi:DNA-binding beta-propeller fold protein YncE